MEENTPEANSIKSGAFHQKTSAYPWDPFTNRGISFKAWGSSNIIVPPSKNYFFASLALRQLEGHTQVYYNIGYEELSRENPLDLWRSLKISPSSSSPEIEDLLVQLDDSVYQGVHFVHQVQRRVGAVLGFFKLEVLKVSLRS